MKNKKAMGDDNFIPYKRSLWNWNSPVDARIGKANYKKRFELAKEIYGDSYLDYVNDDNLLELYP